MFISDDNYPMGAANDSRAPYNETGSGKVLVRKKISVVLTKEIEVEVDEDFEVDNEAILKDYLQTYGNPCLYIKRHEMDLKRKSARLSEDGLPSRCAKDLQGIEGWDTETVEIDDAD